VKKNEPKASRRVQIADATIQILARGGIHGVTHRMVDRVLELPEGSTSNYFRTHIDLLANAANRLVQMDLQEVQWRVESIAAIPADAAARKFADKLAATILDWLAPAKRERTLARCELFLEATRDDALNDIMTQTTREFMAMNEDCFRLLGARRPAKAAVSLIHFILGTLYGQVILPASPSNSSDMKALCRSAVQALRER